MALRLLIVSNPARVGGKKMGERKKRERKTPQGKEKKKKKKKKKKGEEGEKGREVIDVKWVEGRDTLPRMASAF